jgi:hypothetical protein
MIIIITLTINSNIHKIVLIVSDIKKLITKFNQIPYSLYVGIVMYTYKTFDGIIPTQP